MTTEPDELFDYLKVEMIRNAAGDSQFLWFDRLRGAYSHNGRLSEKQIGVLVNVSGGAVEFEDAEAVLGEVEHA